MCSETIRVKELKKDLGLVLAVCLQDVAQTRPHDPIAFIAHWLYKYMDNSLYFSNKESYFKTVRASMDMEREKRRMSGLHMKQLNLQLLRLKAFQNKMEAVEDLQRLSRDLGLFGSFSSSISAPPASWLTTLNSTAKPSPGFMRRSHPNMRKLFPKQRAAKKKGLGLPAKRQKVKYVMPGFDTESEEHQSQFGDKASLRGSWAISDRTTTTGPVSSSTRSSGSAGYRSFIARVRQDSMQSDHGRTRAQLEPQESEPDIAAPKDKGESIRMTFKDMTRRAGPDVAQKRQEWRDRIRSLAQTSAPATPKDFGAEQKTTGESSYGKLRDDFVARESGMEEIDESDGMSFVSVSDSEQDPDGAVSTRGVYDERGVKRRVAVKSRRRAAAHDAPERTQGPPTGYTNVTFTASEKARQLEDRLKEYYKHLRGGDGDDERDEEDRADEYRAKKQRKLRRHVDGRRVGSDSDWDGGARQPSLSGSEIETASSDTDFRSRFTKSSEEPEDGKPLPQYSTVVQAAHKGGDRKDLRDVYLSRRAQDSGGATKRKGKRKRRDELEAMLAMTPPPVELDYDERGKKVTQDKPTFALKETPLWSNLKDEDDDEKHDRYRRWYSSGEQSLIESLSRLRKSEELTESSRYRRSTMTSSDAERRRSLWTSSDDGAVDRKYAVIPDRAEKGKARVPATPRRRQDSAQKEKARKAAASKDTKKAGVSKGKKSKPAKPPKSRSHDQGLASEDETSEDDSDGSWSSGSSRHSYQSSRSRSPSRDQLYRRSPRSRSRRPTSGSDSRSSTDEELTETPRRRKHPARNLDRDERDGADQEKRRQVRDELARRSSDVPRSDIDSEEEYRRSKDLESDLERPSRHSHRTESDLGTRSVVESDSEQRLKFRRKGELLKDTDRSSPSRKISREDRERRRREEELHSEDSVSHKISREDRDRRRREEALHSEDSVSRKISREDRDRRRREEALHSEASVSRKISREDRDRRRREEALHSEDSASRKIRKEGRDRRRREEALHSEDSVSRREDRDIRREEGLHSEDSASRKISREDRERRRREEGLHSEDSVSRREDRDIRREEALHSEDSVSRKISREDRDRRREEALHSEDSVSRKISREDRGRRREEALHSEDSVSRKISRADRDRRRREEGLHPEDFDSDRERSVKTRRERGEDEGSDGRELHRDGSRHRRSLGELEAQRRRAQREGGTYDDESDEERDDRRRRRPRRDRSRPDMKAERPSDDSQPQFNIRDEDLRRISSHKRQLHRDEERDRNRLAEAFRTPSSPKMSHLQLDKRSSSLERKISRPKMGKGRAREDAKTRSLRRTLDPIPGEWYFLPTNKVMVFSHPLLGELRSRPTRHTRPDDIWDSDQFSCQSLYDHDIYTVCDRHADDQQYNDVMLHWTGTTWVTPEKDSTDRYERKVSDLTNDRAESDR